VASLSGSAAVALGLATATLRPYLEEVRRRHPNAYAPWTADEEARLIERYQAGVSIGDMAQEFGRRPGALNSRLLRILPPAPDQREPENGYDGLPDDEEPDWL